MNNPFVAYCKTPLIYRNTSIHGHNCFFVSLRLLKFTITHTTYSSKYHLVVACNSNHTFEGILVVNIINISNLFKLRVLSTICSICFSCNMSCLFFLFVAFPWFARGTNTTLVWNIYWQRWRAVEHQLSHLVLEWSSGWALAELSSGRVVKWLSGLVKAVLSRAFFDYVSYFGVSEQSMYYILWDPSNLARYFYA